MVDKNTLIKVLNRDSGNVGYTIPDLGNLHRDFSSGETKTVTFEEIEKLSFIRGGDYILKHCLVILDNEEAVEAILGQVEPEYYYTAEDVDNLLANGTLDQLYDALDYAPSGVIELIKQKAVSSNLNDVQKRNAILEKTGFNVSKAIEINIMAGQDATEEKPSERRAQPITAKKQTGRKAEPIKKVESKETKTYVVKEK